MPGSVAESRVSLGAIVGKPGRVQRSMKSDIAHRRSGSQRHTEGLNPTIKILVIDRIFIMPNPRDRARHFVGNEGTAIDSRNRFDSIDGRSGPYIDVGG